MLGNENMTVRIYHIAIVMGGLGLLAWLGKRHPQSLGRFTHMWIGPKPYEGQPARQYYLHWAKASLGGFLALIFCGLIIAVLGHWLGLMDNVYFTGPFAFTMFLLLTVALIRTTENLFKAFRYRHEALTLTEKATEDSHRDKQPHR